MAQIGYARVSSTGQNLETQLDRLAHCDKIFQEKKTGTSIQRPQLTACLEYIREGDIVVITKLDRLAPVDFAFMSNCPNFGTQKS